MIIVEVYYRAKPGKRAEILELAKDNIAKSRQEKGNLSYSHYPSFENDQDVFVFEKWEEAEDLIAHTKMPHHQAFSAARRPLLEDGSFKITVWDSTVNEATTNFGTGFVKENIN
ncbi:antibiotic biosynthesis monooxygenase [Ruminococcaceae bacterium OttesenSCG-928-O06]|nr:antibiotic biosynthesis monooxygenase [Ruminococcaceae bacterium OttesenSCG-928-O06]